jgi:hypothetical protein
MAVYSKKLWLRIYPAGTMSLIFAGAQRKIRVICGCGFAFLIRDGRAGFILLPLCAEKEQPA